ncbi:RRM domain-containing protein [Haematococcus lacustris]|uniref:RRM domain-containing protein n=1 Tax=Haematococcus lacustris TaxID=44745 RepID=A0A699ZEP7_HAELA|nr:RRM domain-containing protein [Haematococcus lacustris]
MAASLGPVGFMPVSNRGDNPPCNTLFIGNLSDQVSEMELMALFSAQAGFRQMKLVRGAKQVSCFVEFEDVMSAAAVHATYQGAVLPSSERGGIRIQYSKNPFGRRQLVDMSTSSPNMGMSGGGAGSSAAFAGSAALDNFPQASYAPDNWHSQGLLQGAP